ncbi:MAG TPA: hypothetical protein DCG34_11025 [Clostridiales bacterium]|nr:hypothetical protein [Clostridiales bacterium]
MKINILTTDKLYEEMLTLPESERGGYSAGYHAIQAYLQNTGKTIAEGTKAFIDGEDIIKQSGYFVAG